MRSSSVSSERASIQQVCGSSCEPVALRTPRTWSTIDFTPATAPATRSLWPPTYLVKEYTHRSTPCVQGWQNTGPSMVLSQTMSGRTSALAACR